MTVIDVLEQFTELFYKPLPDEFRETIDPELLDKARRCFNQTIKNSPATLLTAASTPDQIIRGLVIAIEENMVHNTDLNETDRRRTMMVLSIVCGYFMAQQGWLSE